MLGNLENLEYARNVHVGPSDVGKTIRFGRCNVEAEVVFVGDKPRSLLLRIADDRRENLSSFDRNNVVNISIGTLHGSWPSQLVEFAKAVFEQQVPEKPAK